MKTKLILPALIVLQFTTFAGVTRYWIGGGTANFNDGTHWSYASGGGQIGGTISWAIDDIAIFNSSSGSPTVIFTSSEQIGKLLISGSITVTFKPNTSASRTLGVNAVASDALVVGSGAVLIIRGQDSTTDRDMHVELDNTSGVIASISGTIKVSDDMTGYGEFSREGSYPTINFNSGSTYEHNSKETGSDIPEAMWNAASTCLITGITTDLPGNLAQSFGHLTWNCTSQTDNFNLPNLPALQGNLTLSSTGSGGLRMSEDVNTTWTLGGSYTQSGGNFYPSGNSADNVINVGGNFSFTGGILSCPGSGSCLFRFNTSGTHTFNKSTEVTFYQKIHFEVMSGAVVDMGESVIDNSSTGYFTLNSGGGLKTAHAQGIASSGSSGCIQLTGARYFSSASSYTFYRNGTQATGSGLQSSLSGTLTIGSIANATNLTISNGSVAMTGALVLVSNSTANSSIVTGTVSFTGTSNSLEYQGASVQTTTNKEFPLSSGPYNLKINNPYGVILHTDRTITGALSLMSGPFQIAGHTLTLNGAVIKTGGILKGGLSSNIIVSGTSASTNLPSVALNNLTLNRPNGMGLSGNDTVYGTFTLTQGAVSLNGFALVYGPSATLRYNGTITQTTNSAEFPAGNGPYHLDNSNPQTLNLHASRTLQGNLLLNNGNFAIGGNTLTLNGSISGTGAITGGNSSNITFGGTGSSTTLPGITLSNLVINRDNGILMGGQVTVVTNLILMNGDFMIGNNTLYLDNELVYNGGNLVGGNLSNLVFSGQGSTGHLNSIILNQLTLNRPSGLYIDESILVEGTFSLVTGNLYREGNSMYGINARLKYQGFESQITSQEEWPLTNGPHHIEIFNPNGVYLDGDRTIEGDLNVMVGDFSIGDHELILEGVINLMFGNLIGGPASELTISGDGPGTPIPAIELKNLSINRPAGAWLNGWCIIDETLDLSIGTLNVNNMWLYLLGGPISGNPDNLVTMPLSCLFVGGDTNVFIPSSVIDLNYLMIANNYGVRLMSDITLSYLCEVQGYLLCGEHMLMGDASVSILPGARFATGHPVGIMGTIGVNQPSFLSSDADYEFNAVVPQETGFLETSTPGLIRNLIISSSEGVPVTLTEDITASESVQVAEGSVFIIPDGKNLAIFGE